MSLGHVTIVINGVVVKDEVEDHFIGSTNIKPKSLANKLTLFVTYYVGMWYSTQGYIAKLNVLR